MQQHTGAPLAPAARAGRRSGAAARRLACAPAQCAWASARSYLLPCGGELVWAAQRRPGAPAMQAAGVSSGFRRAGQHLVSAAAAEVAGAETVSWELGARCGDADAGAADDAIAVELGVPALSAAQVQARARRPRARLSLPAWRGPLAALRWRPAVLSLSRRQMGDGAKREGVGVCGAALHSHRRAGGRAAAPAARSPARRPSHRLPRGCGRAAAECGRRRSKHCATARARARAGLRGALQRGHPRGAAGARGRRAARRRPRPAALAAAARRAAAAGQGAPRRTPRRALGRALLAVPASRRTWGGAGRLARVPNGERASCTD